MTNLGPVLIDTLRSQPKYAGMSEKDLGAAFALVIGGVKQRAEHVDCGHPRATRYWIQLLKALQDPSIAQKGTTPEQTVAVEKALAECASGMAQRLLGQGFSFDTDVPSPSPEEVAAAAKAMHQKAAAAAIGLPVPAAGIPDDEPDLAGFGLPPQQWTPQNAARQLQMSMAAFALADAARGREDWQSYDCIMQALSKLNPEAYNNVRALTGIDDASYELYRQFPEMRDALLPATPPLPGDELRGGLTGIVYKPKANGLAEVAFGIGDQIALGALALGIAVFVTERAKDSNSKEAQEAAKQERIKIGNLTNDMAVVKDTAKERQQAAPVGSERRTAMERVVEKLNDLQLDTRAGLLDSSQVSARLDQIMTEIDMAPSADEKKDESKDQPVDEKKDKLKDQPAVPKDSQAEEEKAALKKSKEDGEPGPGKGGGGGEVLPPGFEPPILIRGADLVDPPGFVEAVGPDLEQAFIENLQLAQELLMQAVRDELAKFDFVEDHPEDAAFEVDDEFFGIPYIVDALRNCHLMDPVPPGML